MLKFSIDHLDELIVVGHVEIIARWSREQHSQGEIVFNFS
jgi:hypothetical protein